MPEDEDVDVEAEFQELIAAFTTAAINLVSHQVCPAEVGAAIDKLIAGFVSDAEIVFSQEYYAAVLPMALSGLVRTNQARFSHL